MNRPTIVIIGAGLGGAIAAFDIRHVVGDRARVVMVSKGDVFHFTPSNPWVAVRWRTRDAIEVRLPDVMRRKGVEFINVPATRIRPDENEIDLSDGRALHYDYLVIATGPDLAFDEIPGLGPEGHTVSICHVDHAVEAAAAFDAFMEAPGPIVVGAVQGASCFGPAYEFVMILDTELRRRKLRDRAPMTFVTSEPYIGHLGLDGVGDTKGLLESEMRQRHIKWITNARVTSVDAGMMHVEEVAQDGSVKASHDLPFSYSMMLPAFRGVEAIRGVEGLTNPRGFVLVDKHQRNPTWPDIFALGVCIAIPPTGPTPVPVGVPKTGFMIESMVTAISINLRDIIDGKPPTAEASWNAICLADFGDEGVAFIAQPQIPPRNINWAARGRWVHAAKAAFERYFLHKVRRGQAEPLYEKLALSLLGAPKLRSPAAPSSQETTP
ncbi:FAD-dependent oxidoreductase [Brevundimonas sp. BAL450]|jgi:sulfide:quinone oxidoreductase|uniref:Sulfide-quinone reductase n=1 Tax=Brevundimonas abyssalis TAR-001 TaxID=1391729 RepID=A0A8E0ND24_9CAUL|nr:MULTISPECIES: FAD-dependent oxidoreductase [Brevundimonas]MBG7616070.1 FAD-dependent oxidoreductase [Brevundimonas sp. BAL450]GAD60110.1 sulfide-quinone reductase [Brevundimonas abyssalis TAR-001]